MSNFKVQKIHNPIIAIIQARMSSTRLPQKVMMEICGKPILWHVVHRLKPSKYIQDIIVATTIESEDNIIAEKCKEWGVNLYRGSLDDVLDRYYQAAKIFNAKTIVRITADCPLIDPEVVDLIIKKYLEEGCDHVGIEQSYPDGLDVEAFSFDALERAWKEAKLASEREHVTPYIWKNKNIFKMGVVKYKQDLSFMRWTVDDERDFRFVKTVYEAFNCTERVFLMQEILDLLKKRPEIMEINSGTIRNEGYLKSLREDKAVR